MSTMRISIEQECDLTLSVCDFNRLRWSILAIESNGHLRQLLSRMGCSAILDSVTVAARAIDPVAGAAVILWDGLNSQMELLRKRPELRNRSDLLYLYVGAFREVSQALPHTAQPLFARRSAADSAPVSTPFSFRTLAAAKTCARASKNLLAAPLRHTALASGGKLVFCGLVRPTPSVLGNILTNQRLMSLRSDMASLGNMHWADDEQRIRTQVQAIYRKCRNLRAEGAEDFGGIYSVLNVCARMAVVSQLHAAKCRLFINEYGFQSNFDPYDSYAYGNNMFLDFGSSRGACHWYPRTMDMRATGKKFVAMRLIGEDQSLGDYLRSHDEQDYAEQLSADVANVLSALD